MKLHNAICNNSTAIKLQGMHSLHTKALCAAAAYANHPDIFILDVASSGPDPTIAYLQCLTKDKDKTVAFAQKFIFHVTKSHPNILPPNMVTGMRSPQDIQDNHSLATMTSQHTQATFNSRFQSLKSHIMSSNTNPTPAPKPISRGIPKTIHSQFKSFAEVLLQGTTVGDAHSMSQGSDITSSTGSPPTYLRLTQSRPHEKLN